MASERQPLAKLTRPRSNGVIPRSRLFTRLQNEFREREAIGIIGPPGAGKTTLVATWMEAHKLEGIWYQLDADDSDPASFFYYLARSADALGARAQHPLPLLRPEYLGDPDRFARRFFRALFSRAPGLTLVLDNYQDLPETSPLHRLLAIGVEQVPRGAGIVLISRRDPPECYARLLANGRIGRLGWSELQLTLDECEAIARRRAGAAVEDLGRLCEQSNGWAAGFTLLLEPLRRGPAPAEPTDIDSLRTVFDYLATQLYDQATPHEQRMLLELSCLPFAPESVAGQLVGREGIGLLEDLHTRHLFTERRRAREAIYQFHALLAAFLVDRAEQDLPPPERTALRLRSARALDACGYRAEAWPLYLAAGEAAEAERIIVDQAPALIAQGRWKAVIDSIERLPAERSASSPALNLWRGQASMAVDPAHARAYLECSYALASRAEDKLCQVLAASAVIQTYVLQYTHFKPLDRWAAILHDALRAGVAFPSADVELRVQGALLIALAYRQPSHPALPACVERVMELVEGEADVNLRAIGAAYVFGYGATTGPTALSRRTLPVLQKLLEHPTVTPLNRAWSNFLIAWFHCAAGNFEQSELAAEEIHRVEVDEGLPHAHKFHVIISGWREMFRGSPETARPWVAQLAEIQSASRPYDTATYHVTTAWHRVLTGHAEEALEHYARGLALFDEVGSMMHQVIYRFYAGFALAICGRYSEASHVVEQARQLAGPGMTAWQACALGAAEAYAALQAGDKGHALRALKDRFALGREQGEEAGVVSVLGKFMPTLCALALENGIEVEHVRALVRRHGWDPPSPGIAGWPASVRISTLGQFAVTVGGAALTFGRKLPRKPLAVLKMMIAMGGVDVPEQRLMDALWPDQDGDAAYSAYKVALHRLRTLLGDGCVMTAGGMVGLNPQRCRLDLWDLERLLAFVTPALKEEPTDAIHKTGEIRRCAAEIAGLYRGPFLPGDGDARWAMPMREKLRRRYIEFVETFGQHLEHAGRWADAAQWYQGGLQADELAESFYQGLMRCYEQTDRRSEAIAVYRRMRETLSNVLGINPSEQSERLHASIRGIDVAVPGDRGLKLVGDSNR